MKDILKDLAQLKKGIDEAKTNISKLDGREQETVKQLQSAEKLSTLEEAKSLYADLEKQEQTLIAEIKGKYKELKEQYDW